MQFVSGHYAGINIPDNIIIYEKLNSEHQGYICDPSNAKSIEAGANWAATYDRFHDENGQWKSTKYEGVSHTYPNGDFELEIKDAAASSWSQQGKLSFWNCSIKAPDGKVFLIGINSECLCDLIRGCTVINGKVTEKVYLGKRKGQTCAYTKNHEMFLQAKQDAKMKEKVKSSGSTKYEIGDIVRTLKSSQIYLGEMFKQFSVDIPPSWMSEKLPVRHYTMYIHTEPLQVLKKVHLFVDEKSAKESPVPCIDEKENKPKRAVAEHTDITYDEIKRIGMKSIQDALASDDPTDHIRSHQIRYYLEQLGYTMTGEPVTQADIERIKWLCEKYHEVYVKEAHYLYAKTGNPSMEFHTIFL